METTADSKVFNAVTEQQAQAIVGALAQRQIESRYEPSPGALTFTVYVKRGLESRAVSIFYGLA